MEFFVDENIAKANTLPALFYKSDEVFELMKEKIFKSSFQWIGDHSIFAGAIKKYPFYFLENYIDCLLYTSPSPRD